MRKNSVITVVCACVVLISPSFGSAQAPAPESRPETGAKPPAAEPAPAPTRPSARPEAREPEQKSTAARPEELRPKASVPVEVRAVPRQKVDMERPPEETDRAPRKKKEKSDAGFWVEAKLRVVESAPQYYYPYMGLLGYQSRESRVSAPKIVLGYRFKGLMIGISFDVLGWKYKNEEEDDGPEFTHTMVGFSFAPVVQYDLLRKGPAALYLQLMFGYGHMWEKETVKYPNEPIETTKCKANMFTIDAAFGFRYFLSRHFALGLELGAMEVLVSWYDDDDDTSTSTTLTYGAVTAVGFW